MPRGTAKASVMRTEASIKYSVAGSFSMNVSHTGLPEMYDFPIFPVTAPLSHAPYCTRNG